MPGGLFEHATDESYLSSLAPLQPISSLPRLFTREDGTQRASIVTDSRLTMGDLSALIGVNPLQKLMTIAFSSAEGLRRGLSWLCLFAASGVDIPHSTFLDFASKCSRFQVGLQDCTALVKATLYSVWLRAIGRHELQFVIATLFAHLELQIAENLQSRQAVVET